jgi:hypothetical protein
MKCCGLYIIKISKEEGAEARLYRGRGVALVKVTTTGSIVKTPIIFEKSK